MSKLVKTICSLCVEIYESLGNKDTKFDNVYEKGKSRERFLNHVKKNMTGLNSKNLGKDVKTLKKK